MYARELVKELATMADIENEHRREEDERLDAELPDTELPDTELPHTEQPSEHPDERLDDAPVEHDEV